LEAIYLVGLIKHHTHSGNSMPENQNQKTTIKPIFLKWLKKNIVICEQTTNLTSSE